jgi:hypothetical protein
MWDVSFIDLCIVLELRANSRERKMGEVFVIEKFITA